MAELRAPEQNRLLGQLARMLRTTEGDIAAPEFLPKGLDVMGLVRQLMLPSAETVEKLSYGDPLFRMPTQSNIPITADREYLADVVGMAPMVPAASRATTRLSNEAADQLVRAITGTQATAPQVLEAAGQMLPLSRMISPEIAAQVLPKTKAVDEAGNPKMFYHGTAEDVQEFLPGRVGAIYVSPDPSFAGTFSRYSSERKAVQAADALDENPEQKAMFLEPIIERAMASGELTSKDFPYHKDLAKAGFIKDLDMYTKDYWVNKFGSQPLREAMDSVGIGNQLKVALGETAETGPNILPLYVDAKNPFDYEKPSHIAKVMKQLSESDPDYYSGQRKTNLKKALQSGSWEDIENTDVQDAIKELGFDAFYIKEQGVKNLGLYNPNQVRSAASDFEMGGLLNP
jgi:hypothetical protein